MKFLKDKMNEGEFPTWWKNPIWLLFKEYFRNKVFLVAPVFFIFYWIVPFIITLLGSSPDVSTFSISSNHEPLSYLKDTTHLIFAITISIASMVAIYTLFQIPITIKKLSNENVINTSIDIIKSKYILNRKVANSVYSKLLSFIIMIITAILFVRFFYLPEYDYWWGNIKYSNLNIYFIFVEMIMVYYGTQFVFLIIINSRLIIQIINLGLTPKIFHQDNSNGLSPLGKIIMLKWIIALFMIACVFIVLFFGYLGIENSFLTQLLISIFSLVIPVIAILPLLKSLSKISGIKKGKLKIFGRLLNNELDLIEKYTLEDNLEKVKSYVTSFVEKQQVYDTFNKMNVFPFNPKALVSVVIIYSIQIGITIYQLFGG